LLSEYNVFLLSPFSIHIISRHKDIVGTLSELFEKEAINESLPASDNTFKINLTLGDPGRTIKTGARYARYSGRFPEGAWTLIAMGCRCKGNKWTADCIVRPGSMKTLKVRLVGLLKVLYSDILPFMNGLVLHASSLAISGRAQVFTAPSGVGKSTISTILPGKLITDDFTPIFFSRKGPITLASPFVTWGNRRYQQSQAPLAAINGISRSGRWHTNVMGVKDAISCILQNTISFAQTPSVNQALLDQAIDLAGMVTVKGLGFSLEIPSTEVINSLFT